jgi:shikimate dehydrogenase
MFIGWNKKKTSNFMSKKQQKRTFGLIGFPLGHSFSKRYFTDKFEREQIEDCQYDLFPMEFVAHLPVLLDQNPSLCGLNVTIPHKQAVIPYLDGMDAAAKAVGAVNCIKIDADGRLTGYNTDAIGFKQSLKNKADGKWASVPTQAIVLGNGGAARAVFYVLQQLGIPYQVISRKPDPNNAIEQDWKALPSIISGIKKHSPDSPVLVVNTTPVGMAPNTDMCPELPFELLDKRFLIFDLIYNPTETVLLRQAASKGCATLNGLEMLYLQADAAWEVWNMEGTDL